jgi:serine/threonine-protein kinase RsbW
MAASFEQQVQEYSLDSSIDSVDQAELSAVELARKIGFSEDDQHSISMAVRECMVNAVAHGNKYNTRKKVFFRLDGRADRLVIEVGDEGDGFRDEEIPDPLAQENLLKQSGRGLLLMRAFMDECDHASRSPQGTLVRMVKYRKAS